MAKATKWVIRTTLAFVAMTFSAAAFAEEVSFFGTGIDYWNDKPKAAAREPEAVATPATETVTEQLSKAKPSTPKPTDPAGAGGIPKGSDGEKFDWQPFLDAKNKEFFREGDYTPPEPFMEIVRNPSDANLRMWFAYIERKNTLAQRLAERMDEYVRRNGGSMSPEAQVRVQTVANNLPRTEARDYKNLRFRMYFDSTCPHCKKMFQTLNELQSRGYFVEARQVDQGPTQHLGSEVPIMPASREELKKFAVNSVPLVLIGDMKGGKVFRHSGYQSTNELLESVNASAAPTAP